LKAADDVVAQLKQHGIEPRLVSEMTVHDTDWADVVVTVGGDGTFLKARARAHTPGSRG
jgi:NAD kinase